MKSYDEGQNDGHCIDERVTFRIHNLSGRIMRCQSTSLWKIILVIALKCLPTPSRLINAQSKAHRQKKEKIQVLLRHGFQGTESFIEIFLRNNFPLHLQQLVPRWFRMKFQCFCSSDHPSVPSSFPLLLFTARNNVISEIICRISECFPVDLVCL